MQDQTTQDDLWLRVQSMVEADLGSASEVKLRFGVITSACVAMTWATEDSAITIWLGLFLAFNGTYSLLLARTRPPVRPSYYVLLNGLLMISIALYTSCAIYLFMMDSPVFKTIAVASLAAQSLFNLSRHRIGGVLAIYDTVIVFCAAIYMGFMSLDPATQTLPEILTIVISVLGVACYYAIAQSRNITVHRRLQEAHDTAIQTQKMRAVGQLTAGIAHDFNNILTVIGGNIDLARSDLDAAARDERLHDAKQAADRAAKLTSQLLAFSRKAPLETTQVDMAPFWEGFAAILRRVSPASMVAHVHADPALSHLICDRTQLDNALLNLVINATDACGGRGHLWLTSRPPTPQEWRQMARYLDGRGPFGIVEVRDNGPGIADEDLSRVTEPFFTTKPVGEGSGLGLSMVKGFAEQSGGMLLIETGADGTSVKLALPTS